MSGRRERTFLASRAFCLVELGSGSGLWVCGRGSAHPRVNHHSLQGSPHVPSCAAAFPLGWTGDNFVKF